MESQWTKEELISATRNLVESQIRDGHIHLPIQAPKIQPSVPKTSATPSKQAPSVSGGLADVRTELGDCTRCQLHKGRKHIVFGVGNPQADFLIVGEAPGRDEDLQGEPFVGQAGKLLTDILGAIGLSRNDVYICNVIKCRPPNNRPPEPDEVETCSPFMKAQIKAIQPKMICTLGKFATQTVLQTERPISAIRGNFHTYEGIPVMPTFHPAFLLRNPAAKKEVWEDMKKIHAELCRITGKNLVRKGN